MNPVILLSQCCWFRLYVTKFSVIYGNWAKPQTQHAESCALRTQYLRNPQCAMGIWPHLVMPTVGFDRPNSHEQAFSRIQRESWIFTTWSRLYFEYSKSSLLRQRHSTLWGTRNQQPHGEPATWQSSSTDRRSICRSPIGILSYKLHLTVVKVPNSGYSILVLYHTISRYIHLDCFTRPASNSRRAMTSKSGGGPPLPSHLAFLLPGVSLPKFSSSCTTCTCTCATSSSIWPSVSENQCSWTH